jgi:hypothetical protein
VGAPLVGAPSALPMEESTHKARPYVALKMFAKNAKGLRYSNAKE